MLIPALIRLAQAITSKLHCSNNIDPKNVPISRFSLTNGICIHILSILLVMKARIGKPLATDDLGQQSLP